MRFFMWLIYLLIAVVLLVTELLYFRIGAEQSLDNRASRGGSDICHIHDCMGNYDGHSGQ